MLLGCGCCFVINNTDSIRLGTWPQVRGWVLVAGEAQLLLFPSKRAIPPLGERFVCHESRKLCPYSLGLKMHWGIVTSQDF